MPEENAEPAVEETQPKEEEEVVEEVQSEEETWEDKEGRCWRIIEAVGWCWVLQFCQYIFIDWKNVLLLLSGALLTSV